MSASSRSGGVTGVQRYGVTELQGYRVACKVERKAGSECRDAGCGFVLAIDGPAGSGKSTTAKMCARRLGFRHLDTGAMYRAMTLEALRVRGLKGARAPVAGAEFERLLRTTRIGVNWREEEMRVSLNGEDVSEEIRHPMVSELVSEVSAVPAVRRKLVAEQRRAAKGHDVVCEGRDIGSVVFPGADVKVFLDCNISARGARRLRELDEKGVRSVRAEGVLENLKKRDRMDSTRKVSPLVRVVDAVLVDTTMLTIEEQVEVVCALVRRKTGAAKTGARRQDVRRRQGK